MMQKFKVWDRRNSKWLDHAGITSEGTLLTRDYSDGGGYGLKVENFPKDYEVCSSTGLKDKNGREIYEGDIVKYKDFKPQEIVWEPSVAGFFMGSLVPGTLDCEFEIIGNKFEHPELYGAS